MRLSLLDSMGWRAARAKAGTAARRRPCGDSDVRNAGVKGCGGIRRQRHQASCS
ncbi:hypothetical protein C7S13_1984 [Burkholderia cepacia]|nr:hypothetical protein [Burkholderia cepacia]